MAAGGSALRELLGCERPTEVLDVGANPLEDEAPYLRMLRAGTCRVTGFEPQTEALQRLQAAAGPLERYLPQAVGDGAEHLMHLCASSGFSSLFEPDEQQLALLVDFPRLAQVVATEQVATTRLDDVADLGQVDHLKMDVQGAELMVLQGGHRALGGTTTVQVEVGFHRLYVGQPTFAEVDLELRGMGFVPQQFVSTRTWPLAPVVWAEPLQAEARQLVEADLLYVRDLARLDELDDEQVRQLAAVCHEVYGQRGVALRAVRELVARGVLDESAEQAYRDLPSSPPLVVEH